MDIPAAFELGIQAGGRTNLAAHDVDVVLDFGGAEIEVCDYTPEPAVTNVVAEDKSHRRLEIEELQQEEKFHIRCLISSPVFDQVIISGGNIDRGISIDFAQYQASLVSERAESVGFWPRVRLFFCDLLHRYVLFQDHRISVWGLTTLGRLLRLSSVVLPSGECSTMSVDYAAARARA